jgi:hypothetical protein
LDGFVVKDGTGMDGEFAGGEHVEVKVDEVVFD